MLGQIFRFNLLTLFRLVQAVAHGANPTVQNEAGATRAIRQSEQESSLNKYICGFDVLLDCLSLTGKHMTRSTSDQRAYRSTT